MRIVYGINPAREVLKTNARGIEKVLYTLPKTSPNSAAADIVKEAKGRGVKTIETDRKELDKVSDSPQHQGVVLLVRQDYEYKVFEDIVDNEGTPHKLIVLLDGITDPQNFGSIIRASVCAGATGIMIPKDRSVAVTPVVTKASAGATEHIDIAKVTNIASAIRDLKDANIWVGGLAGGEGEDIFKSDLKRDLAIVVGSEGDGMRRLVKEECDFLLSIPMSGGFDSLNASQAAVVALFEARRQSS